LSSLKPHPNLLHENSARKPQNARTTKRLRGVITTRRYTNQCLPYLTLPYNDKYFCSVAALHQGATGQMTWLEDPPPWFRPA